MEISSVLSTGIEGIKRGVETAQSAAQDIANPQVASDNTTAAPETGAVTTSQGSNTLDTLTESIVDLRVGERQVEASAAVVRTADEMLGTLVDIKA